MYHRNVVTTIEDRQNKEKNKKVTEFLPDNGGVILKRDVNVSAVDKDRQADELSDELVSGMSHTLHFV